MKNYYIKAVVALILGGQDINSVLKNLETVLVNKGHQSLRLAILEGLIRELTKVNQSNSSTITLARNSDETKFKANIVDSLKVIGGELESAKITIDPTITGGYIVTHKGKMIDSSYKTKLLKLYRTITT